MKVGMRKLLAISACLLVLASGAQAVIGLTTRFVDVVLEGLSLGGVYSLRAMKNVPYVVSNRGELPMEIVVEVMPPSSGDLQQSYEPIPDPSWVQVIPDRFNLGIGDSQFSEIVLSIPQDVKLQGRHFQAAIWAHAVDTGFMAVGVRSRLRFSIGQGPESLLAEKKRKAMLSLDLDLRPAKIYVLDVPVGEQEAYDPYEDRKGSKRRLTVTNRAEDTVKLNFTSMPWDVRYRRYTLPPGYEPAPDPAWLSFDPAKTDVEGEMIKGVRLKLKIPDKPEYRGKKYAFLISASIEGQAVPLELASLVFITTATESSTGKEKPAAPAVPDEDAGEDDAR